MHLARIRFPKNHKNCAWYMQANRLLIDSLIQGYDVPRYVKMMWRWQRMRGWGFASKQRFSRVQCCWTSYTDTTEKRSFTFTHLIGNFSSSAIFERNFTADSVQNDTAGSSAEYWYYCSSTIVVEQFYLAFGTQKLNMTDIYELGTRGFQRFWKPTLYGFALYCTLDSHDYSITCTWPRFSPYMLSYVPT